MHGAFLPLLLGVEFLQHTLLIPALFSPYSCIIFTLCSLFLTLFSPYFHHFLMFCWKLHLCSIFCFFLPYSHTIFAMLLKSCIFAADSAYSCLILTLFSPYFCLIFTTFWIFCWKLHFCSIFCLFLPYYSCIILTFFSSHFWNFAEQRWISAENIFISDLFLVFSLFIFGFFVGNNVKISCIYFSSAGGFRGILR